MFLRGSRDHILGNMLFLAMFGKNVEGAYGPLRYLAFYFAGGFAAMMPQAGTTLWFGTAADWRTASLGASGAIAAVLGAYFVLYPSSKAATWVFPVFVSRIPAWAYLGLWFPCQLAEANFGLFKAPANGGGVAFFAHVGGFIFGLLVTALLARAGRVAPGNEGPLARMRPAAWSAGSRRTRSPRPAADGRGAARAEESGLQGPPPRPRKKPGGEGGDAHLLHVIYNQPCD